MGTVVDLYSKDAAQAVSVWLAIESVSLGLSGDGEILGGYCDLLIVHQNELEAQLATHISERDPTVIGNEYIVIGTMERPAWRKGLHEPKQLDEMLGYIADFKEDLNFTVRPAGWFRMACRPRVTLVRTCITGKSTTIIRSAFPIFTHSPSQRNDRSKSTTILLPKMLTRGT